MRPAACPMPAMPPHPFRFVESLYSIGEWIGPHRLQKPQDLLWYADSQPEQGLYRCRNDYRATETTI